MSINTPSGAIVSGMHITGCRYAKQPPRASIVKGPEIARTWVHESAAAALGRTHGTGGIHVALCAHFAQCHRLDSIPRSNGSEGFRTVQHRGAQEAPQMGDLAQLLARVCVRGLRKSPARRNFSQRIAGRSRKPTSFPGAPRQRSLIRTKWIRRFSHCCHWVAKVIGPGKASIGSAIQPMLAGNYGIRGTLGRSVSAASSRCFSRRPACA